MNGISESSVSMTRKQRHGAYCINSLSLHCTYVQLEAVTSRHRLQVLVFQKHAKVFMDTGTHGELGLKFIPIIESTSYMTHTVYMRCMLSCSTCER